MENAAKEADKETKEADEETKETIEESTENVTEDTFDKTIPMPADIDEIIRENESNKGEEK